jgi:hypothetical protein
MSTFKKHVGRIRNTDRRCVVVFMQIPGNENNALVVDTDALPDRFHDALMDIIDSTEGQQTPHLHTLLQRRILPDLGLDMMNALHTYGLLRVVEIDNIVMYPAPNAPCPLRTIVDYMNGEDAPPVVDQQLENRVLENQRTDSAQAQYDIAKNIIRQAMDLEEEAARKREQAYRLVPSLRPEAANTQVTASPEVIETSVTVPEIVSEPIMATEVVHATAEDNMTVVEPSMAPENPIHVDTDGMALPEEVRMALQAATEELNRINGLEEMEGNQVDTSDAALQEFLDRAALREDKADKEKWAAMQPKKPVGRPRKDGLPAGTKASELVATAPAPKKRGRPPKAKK